MADLVEQHWPHLAELERRLAALGGQRVGTASAPGAQPSVSSPARAYTRSEIDAIHEGLLRKNRQSGSLRFT